MRLRSVGSTSFLLHAGAPIYGTKILNFSGFGDARIARYNMVANPTRGKKKKRKTVNIYGKPSNKHFEMSSFNFLFDFPAGKSPTPLAEIHYRKRQDVKLNFQIS